jgi:hypothetical protein
MRDVFRLERGTLIPRDSYLLSYQHILSYFTNIREISASDLVRGAHMAYGWMPTQLDLISRIPGVNFDEGGRLLTAAKARMLTVAEIADLKSLVNNSVIGVSKLLHFVAPNRYAIWDSKVYSFVYEQPPNPGLANNIDRYCTYLCVLEYLREDRRFEGFHMSVQRKVGYEISDLRAIELVMFRNPWPG